MMEFDRENKVIISTMNQEEARAFVKFLQSEVARHMMDIRNAQELIREVKTKFKIENVNVY